jgi:hypothetical protein
LVLIASPLKRERIKAAKRRTFLIPYIFFNNELWPGMCLREQMGFSASFGESGTEFASFFADSLL